MVTENASEGTDLVQSGDHLHTRRQCREPDPDGRRQRPAPATATANVITGNAGDNTLDGAAGADTMIGGAGNDTYVVDNAGDVVTRSRRRGHRSRPVGVSFTLGANVENLTLTGTRQHQRHRQRPAPTPSPATRGNNIAGRRRAAPTTLIGGKGDDTYVVDRPATR